MSKEYLKWSEVDYIWSEIDMTWNEIINVLEVERAIRGGSSQEYEDYVKNNPWKKLSEQIGESKTDQFIKIFCKINGIEYQSIEKKRGKFKADISQFERVFNHPTIKIFIDKKLSSL